MKKVLYTFGIAIFALASCKPHLQEALPPSAGAADFTKYISLGNSLTSGYMDGALYSSGQLNSYPAIIHNQLLSVGTGDFKIPLVPSDIGGYSLLGMQGKLTLQMINGAPFPVSTTAYTTMIDNVSANGPYQNMGVPGAKVGHLLVPGYGNTAGLIAGTANPYFCRFASSNTTSVIADAVAQKPTFFSLWIGNNDVLSYATSGGDSTNSITPTTTFAAYYTALISQLTAVCPNGVIANIPNITDIPFFTKVPYNPLPLTRQTQVDSLNTGMAQYNQLMKVIDSTRMIKFTLGQSQILIQDEGLTNLSTTIYNTMVAIGRPPQEATAAAAVYGQCRASQPGDLILLSSASAIGTPDPNALPGLPTNMTIRGISYPMADKYVLVPSEVSSILTAVASYNATIQSLATSNSLAFFDANATMKILAAQSGMTYNGVTFTASFVTGGAFSLDGVHPTQKGYAIIANGFIDAINSKYGSTIPKADVNKYNGVFLP